MELAIQVVILLTALVGLYKASTYHPESKDHSHEDSSGRQPASNPIADAIGEMLEMFAPFSFMLIIPAVMLAFMWITNAMHNLSDDGSFESKSPTVQISRESTTGEIMLAAALEISSKIEQAEQLEKVIDHTLAKQEFGTAIKAAEAIKSKVESNAQLERIIEAAAALEATDPNSPEPTPKQDQSQTVPPSPAAPPPEPQP